ncbi:MAG: hypothetical protein F9K40_22845 [Kofleriaceae bacterium]|nr:MAG: hypothetical protein F9K40_22845 [Kofleriaceae bacterium]
MRSRRSRRGRRRRGRRRRGRRRRVRVRRKRRRRRRWIRTPREIRCSSAGPEGVRWCLRRCRPGPARRASR